MRAALPAVAAAALLPSAFGIAHPRPKFPSKRSQERFEFAPVHTEAVPHPRYGDLTKSTYLSPAMTLMTGEAWFSLPDVTIMPMPGPGKPYAITAVEYDIIDTTGRSIPLSEMYSHHWLVYDKLVGGTGEDVGCPNGGEDSFVSNVYGAGGEMRGIDYAYPDGYGYVSQSGKQHWSANIHFIRTEDLDTSYYNDSYGAAVKACIECGESPTGPKGHWNKGLECATGLTGCGTLACCFDGTRCPVNNKKDRSTKQYHLKYNVTWTTEVEKVKPVEVKVIDGFGCEICSNVAANKPPKATKCDDKICISEVEVAMTKSGEWLWGYTHQHLGAINSTLFVNGVEKCTSWPIHGTDPKNTPGNEQGYAVAFKMCTDTPQRGMAESFHVDNGDKLRLVSYYNVDPADTSSLPIPGGEHRGTMNLHFFYVAPDDAPAGLYKCIDGRCVENAGGAPLKTCQAAC